MSHLTVNGITLPGAGDAWEESPSFIGDAERYGVNGALLSGRIGRRGHWTTHTAPVTPAIGEAIRHLLDGDGQSWSFDSDVYSDGKGLGPKSGGSYSQSSSGGKHGGYVSVSSANYIAFALANRLLDRMSWDPTQGWTIVVWKNDGASSAFQQYVLTGSVAVTRAASSGDPAGVTQYKNGTSGSYHAAFWFDVTSGGDVSLYGYDDTGAGSSFHYDDLIVLPFAMPSTWVSDLYTYHNANAWPAIPSLSLDGDCVENGPITVRARVPRLQQINGVISGTRYNNARIAYLDIKQAA